MGAREFGGKKLENSHLKKDALISANDENRLGRTKRGKHFG